MRCPSRYWAAGIGLSRLSPRGTEVVATVWRRRCGVTSGWPASLHSTANQWPRLEVSAESCGRVRAGNSHGPNRSPMSLRCRQRITGSHHRVAVVGPRVSQRILPDLVGPTTSFDVPRTALIFVIATVAGMRSWTEITQTHSSQPKRLWCNGFDDRARMDSNHQLLIPSRSSGADGPGCSGRCRRAALYRAESCFNVEAIGRVGMLSQFTLEPAVFGLAFSVRGERFPEQAQPCGQIVHVPGLLVITLEAPLRSIRMDGLATGRSNPSESTRAAVRRCGGAADDSALRDSLSTDRRFRFPRE